MDTTMETAKAIQEQQARNDALTDAQMEEASKQGSQAAAAAIERGENIFLMDEASLDHLQNAYAMGWNSQYGTEANQRLWVDANAKAARSSESRPHNAVQSVNALDKLN